MVLVNSLLTTNVTAMNESNHVALDEKEGKTSKEASEPTADAAAAPSAPSATASDPASPSGESKESNPTAIQIPGYPSHIATPQTGSAAAYYLGYSQSQVTPEPPSPATQANATIAYDGLSFFQQPGAFAPHSSSFVGPSTPLSPPRATTTMGVIPPASPLFPRITAAGPASATALGLEAMPRQAGAPPSPNLPYMSPPFGSAMYQPYPGGPQPSNGSDEGSSWNERNSLSQNSQSAVYQQSSPQIQGMMPYGMTATRAGVGARAYSFEEAMLPPSAFDQQDQANPAYSPYGGSQTSPGQVGATLFAQQSWGYGAPPDMYSTPGTPLQPRPSPQMGMYPGGPAAAGMRQMAPFGQFYPASSPGPPIQTTASNKGPDGANLFIFHIPNHFTNLDMYQLFCPYGNLLSVRIMVEKDTGRSRGFGFVSYDNPESAALAIKELNGFAIGNKRLKVQHKQIRPRDLHLDRDNSHGSFGVSSSDGGYGSHFSSLPPSGPTASQNTWFDNSGRSNSNGSGKAPHNAETKQDESTELTTSTSTAETQLQLGSNESPLASLGTLQNALPDVAGNGNNSE